MNLKIKTLKLGGLSMPTKCMNEVSIAYFEFNL